MDRHDADPTISYSPVEVEALGAALRQCRAVKAPPKLVVAALFVAVLASTTASAAAPAHAKASARLWGVQVQWAEQLRPGLLRSLGARGVNAVIVDRGRWTSAAHTRLLAEARQAGMIVIEPRGAASAQKLKSSTRSCRAQSALVHACTVRAGSVAEAGKLARSGRFDDVVIPVSSSAQLRAVRSSSRPRTPIIAVIPSKIDPAKWMEASGTDSAGNAPGIAIAPTSFKPSVLAPFLTLVARGEVRSVGDADVTAPSVPTGLRLVANTQTSITFVWDASTDGKGVAGYSLFLDGNAAGTTAATNAVFSGLGCGTVHRVEVDAFDAAGNHSAHASASASTLTNCGGGSGSPPPPPPPPSSPSPPPPPPPGGGGNTAPPGTANLWVDTNGGSCARQATPAGYADAQACTWNQAYQAARTGDVVLVKGGNYGNVTVGPSNTSLAAPGVTFRTAGGESVVVNDFENGNISGARGGSNVGFVGPVRARTFRSDQASNVVVDGWTVDCNGCDGEQMFHVEAADNVVVRNSDISDNKNDSLIWIDGSNLTFENNRIHDAALPNGSSAHTECMYAHDVTNLTLKRNHFYHCSVMDVFITGSDVANGGYVENNVFEKPWENTGVISNSALAFHFRNGGSPSPDPSNWDFRYNTFVGPLSITPSENPVGPGGLRVIGNVFLSGDPCGLSNTTYDYNAFLSGEGCGSHTITNSLATYLAGFTNPGDPGDYSLKAGSVLRDKGNPGNYPAQDRAGTARYTGAAPDLGAYEGP
jgi:hypothetical protein